MTAADAWQDARTITRLFAHAPFGSVVHLRGRPGPARDRILSLLRDALPPAAPWRRCPAAIGDARLLGGLDLAATLAAGRSVAGRGLLAEADGGVVLLAGAERLGASTAALLAAALDSGEVAVERDGFSQRCPARIGLVLLDEGDEDNAALPAVLADLVSFRLDLDALPREVPVPDTAPSRPLAPATPRPIAPALAEALCETAAALGIGSDRATLLALRAARSAAALAGHAEPNEDDVILAARLVLAPRATRLPAPPAADTDDAPDPAPPEPAAQDAAADAPGSAEDEGRAGDTPPADGSPPDVPPTTEADPPHDTPATVLAATLASLPPSLLARLATAGAAPHSAASGRAAGRPRDSLHGRPHGSRPGRPDGGARLDLVATLRAAAPLQALRRRDAPPGRAHRLQIRAADLRVQRRQSTPRATTVFVVDASGSAALNRLAEAKGAVELLLAECYVRRDQVALLAFRGTTAELLLPPTGALARARRCLAALPGGGPTPIAAGLDAALALAASLRRRGATPLLVVLTDGRANIGRDGTPDRARATADALDSARRLRAAAFPSLLIDISPRPQPQAAALADAMGARSLFLPRADAAALSRAIRQAA
ncbi:MAG: magnesium chelatase subunit D [Janthinobacterium lividum]